MSNELQTIQSNKTMSAFSNAESFEASQRMAKALVSSDLVPQQFRGGDKLGNAIIALELAQRINASPLMVMQNLYIVHGNPGWSSKFLIATFNQSGKFTSIKYEWRGLPEDDANYGCRAYCTEKATGERINGMWITWKLVKAEGWDNKSGSKWKTMPQKMFMYRAAGWLIDTTAPEIAMGIPTADQLEDIIDINPETGDVLTAADRIEDALTGSVEDVQEAEVVEEKPAEEEPPKETNKAPTEAELIHMIDVAKDSDQVMVALDLAMATKLTKAKKEMMENMADEKIKSLEGAAA